MSSTAANKELVEQAVRRLADGDIDGFMELVGEDVVVRVRWARFRPFEGRERVARLMRGTFSQFERFTSVIDALVQEGPVVVEQSHGTGSLEGGEQYFNNYCRVWRIEAGKIVAMDEYMDTEAAQVLLK